MAPSILIRETFSAEKATDVQTSQRTSAVTQIEGGAPQAQAPSVHLESLVGRRGAPALYVCLSFAVRCSTVRSLGSFHRLQLDRQVVHIWLYDLLIIAITILIASVCVPASNTI